MKSKADILKNAFIDIYCEVPKTNISDFSADFEERMQKLIKSQKSVVRFINTAGKRAAAIAILIIALAFSTIGSVSALREPVVEAIQDFFVNAREFLSGTRADDISALFPQDVTKIIGTSYISKSEKQYIIDEEEKIRDFLTLLSETYWGEAENNGSFDKISTYWSFEFIDTSGKSVLKIDMCNDYISGSSEVAITQNKTQKIYRISNKTYAEILAFTNRKFYLHDSVLKMPEKEFCEEKQANLTENLSDKEKKQIKKSIRNAHYSIEIFLLNNVSLLKEYDSKYWDYVISGETFIDPISGYESDYRSYKSISKDLNYITDTLKNKKAKKDIINALKMWESSIINHDIEGLFKAHEYIHDYDYFGFNYPTRYVYSEFADYQGVDDYFGHME